MLSLQLILHIIAEGTELQTLVSLFMVNFLVKFVFFVIQLLQDILFPFNASLAFFVEGPLLCLQLSAHQVNCLVALYYAVVNLLMNAFFNVVHALFRYSEFVAVVFAHLPDLILKFLSQKSKFVFEFAGESFKSISDSLYLCNREVFIGLYFPSNVLELRLKLFFRFDALHQHDIVIVIHLFQLMIHLLELLIIVLIWREMPHVFVCQLL